MQWTLLTTPGLRQCRNIYGIATTTCQIQLAINVSISLSSSSSCLVSYWSNTKHDDTNSHREKEKKMEGDNVSLAWAVYVFLTLSLYRSQAPAKRAQSEKNHTMWGVRAGVCELLTSTTWVLGFLPQSKSWKTNDKKMNIVAMMWIYSFFHQNVHQTTLKSWKSEVDTACEHTTAQHQVSASQSQINLQQTVLYQR